MCLKVKENIKFKVAKEDIIVYKKVVKIFGRRNKINFKLVKSFYKIYIYGLDIVQPRVRIKIIDNEINEGYHFYKNLSYDDIECYRNKYHSMAMFIIPKGTRYYIKNSINEGVCERIIYKGLIFKDHLKYFMI